MALINCPECNKEISDKVKSCPHCGYPLVEEVSATHEPLNVNVTSINLNQGNKAKMRKTVIRSLVFTFTLIFIFAFITYLKTTKARNNYIDNLNRITTSMNSGASVAEQLCDLTAKVWSNTIYEKFDLETFEYTMSGGGFNSDFNTSLAELFADPDIVKKVKSIESNQALVSNIMKELNNPTDKFEKCYNTLNELFSVYMSLTDLAVNPSGNLQMFNQNKSEKIDAFKGNYRKLKSQIPEK